MRITQPWVSFLLVVLVDYSYNVAALVRPITDRGLKGFCRDATATTTSTRLFQKQNEEDPFLTSRRDAIAAATLMGFGLLTQEPANAFPNKISNQYDDRPKRRGPQPKDLGIGPRMTVFTGEDYTGLKSCGAAPNCFSSTMTVEDDPDHSIPAWVWPSSLGNNQEKAFEELQQVLLAYEPGQKGVDGGGFEIKTYDPVKGYIYVQFESLKNGYIDDVEFAVLPGGGNNEREVQVRSSSRIGYLDFGVNGKRLNAIAKALRSKGWTAEGVDPQTHAFYVSENSSR